MTESGQLKFKHDTKLVSEKLQTREFVLTTGFDTPYPQHVSFQITGDKCSSLDNYTPSDEVTVHFNLKGREWSGPNGVKYFNTLEAWKITGVSQFSKPKPNVQAENHNFVNKQNDNDDLPF